MKTYIKSLLAVVAVALLGSSAQAKSRTDSATIALSGGETTVRAGDDVASWTQKTITWTASQALDADVASVTQISTGRRPTATIVPAGAGYSTCKYGNDRDQYVWTLNLTVTDSKTEDVALAIGGTETADVACSYSGKYKQGAAEWSAVSSDESVATVSSVSGYDAEVKPTITAVDGGKATITVKNAYVTYTYNVTVKGVDKDQTIDLMASETAAPITTYASALKWWTVVNEVADRYLEVDVERLVDATAKVTIKAKGTEAVAEPAIIELHGDDNLVETITVNILEKVDKAEFTQGVAIDSTWTYVTVATGETWEFVPNKESYYTDISRIQDYFTPSIARNEDGTATVSIFGIAPADGKNLIMDVKCDGKVISTINVVIDPAVVDVAIPLDGNVVVTGKYGTAMQESARHWVFNDTTTKGVVGLSMKKGSGSNFIVSNFNAPAGYEDYNKQTDWYHTFVATMTGSKIGADTVYIGRFYNGKSFVSKCYEYHVKVFETKGMDFEIKAGSSDYPQFTSDVAGAWEASSSNPEIVTVEEAGDVDTEFWPMVKGLKQGTATLTVKNNYCVYTVNVTVTPGTENEDLSIKVGETVERVIEGGASATSGNPAIATIALGDQEGTNVFITAVSAGDAICTVKNANKKKLYQYNVKVYETKSDVLAVMPDEYKSYTCESAKAAAWKAESSDPGVVEVVNADGVVSNKFELSIKGVDEGSATITVQNDYVKYTISVNVQDGFLVNYYDTDRQTVVRSDPAKIRTYGTDLHIWDGEREGMEFLGYTKENGEVLEKSDEALRAYIKEEAEKPGCDGEVKVFGTWKKSSITITVVQGEGITDVLDADGESVDEETELDGETTEITLTLEADGLTVPVFKVVRDNVTNVTTKVATYDIADGDTLEFFAEEAEEDDPTVTPDQRKQAIIDAIDEPIPGVPGDEERYVKAVAKVENVVGAGADQVPAKDFAAYITKTRVQSSEIADCDYVAASVKLKTEDLIDEDTEVEIAELVKAEGDALTFEVDIENDRVEVEAIKDMVEASSDLTDWVKHKLEVKAEFDEDECKVTITPKDPTDKAFMRVVIPKDPGVE